MSSVTRTSYRDKRIWVNPEQTSELGGTGLHRNCDPSPAGLLRQRSGSGHQHAAALSTGRAPGNRHLGVEIYAVACVQHLVHAAGIELQLPFQYVNERANGAAGLTHHSGYTCRKLHHARDKLVGCSYSM